MAIHLPKSRNDLTLLSTSELTRLLNIPESQMLRAIREGAVRPLGVVGRVTLIALTDDELDGLRLRFHPPAPPQVPHAHIG
jgi:hypothetical protein